MDAFPSLCPGSVEALCWPDQFECNHAADGCVPWDRVNDGGTDCLRDRSDETKESFALSPFQGGSEDNKASKFREHKTTQSALVLTGLCISWADFLYEGVSHRSVRVDVCLHPACFLMFLPFF